MYHLDTTQKARISRLDVGVVAEVAMCFVFGELPVAPAAKPVAIARKVEHADNCGFGKDEIFIQ